MAETAVTSVIEKLAPLLDGKASLPRGFRGKVHYIKNGFISIQPFLKVADSKAESDDMNGSVKEWVKQVREAAYLLEDVIDEYMFQYREPTFQQGLKGSFLKASHQIKKLKPCQQITSKIREIKTSVHVINVSGRRLGFNISLSEDPINSRSVLPTDDADIVGHRVPKSVLVNQLVMGSEKRKVIVVVGMRGIGKSTLVKKVCDDKRVQGRFALCAWLDVSVSHKMEEQLRSLLKQVHQARKATLPEALDTMNEKQLGDSLREYLEKMKYVIVFDDVWKREFWKKMQNVLPDNGNHNRIIITTCQTDVADSCKKTSFAYDYVLPQLSHDESMELFCKKAFKNFNGGRCPPDLEKLSHKIVKRCEGLPLAIVALGGLLSTKEKVVAEWKKFATSAKEFAAHTTMTKALSNIHNLPYYLKDCFLYLGIFPEDYPINCARLVRLWIAEGFVRETEGRTLDEVAQEYLEVLVSKGLVQELFVDDFGRRRSCQVHCLMREIILSKTQEMNFSHVYVDEEPRIFQHTRRLSIHKRRERFFKGIGGSRLRSLFLFDKDELSKSLLNKFFKSFNLLKVLDLEKASLVCLPKEVGDLVQLSYLSVRDTKVHKLPKSIGNLQNLETLDLKRSLVDELPVEIERLQKLRNLLVSSANSGTKFGFDSVRGVKMMGKIGSLDALEKLYYMGEYGAGHTVEDLGNLTRLKKLGIEKLTKEGSGALCTALEKMKNLQSLSAYSISESEILDLQAITSPPPDLQSVYLGGFLEKFPAWIQKTEYLVRINLCGSRLVDDPLKELQNLSYLVEVGFYKAFDGKQLHFEKGSFRQLRLLRLEELDNLKSMKVDKGAMGVLQKLTITNCKKLQFPSGIQHLKKLESLEVHGMPLEFLRSMLPNVGQSTRSGYQSVAHIKNILFHHNIGGCNEYVCYNLHSVKYSKMEQGRRIQDVVRRVTQDSFGGPPLARGYSVVPPTTDNGDNVVPYITDDQNDNVVPSISQASFQYGFLFCFCCFLCIYYVWLLQKTLGRTIGLHN